MTELKGNRRFQAQCYLIEEELPVVIFQLFLHWTRNSFCSTVTMELPCPFNDFLIESVLVYK